MFKKLSHPMMYVTDLDGDLTKLKNAGVKTGNPRTEGGSTRFVTFWDSEGNALGIEEFKN